MNAADFLTADEETETQSAADYLKQPGPEPQAAADFLHADDNVPELNAAPAQSLLERGRRSLSPLLGPTEEQKLEDGMNVVGADGQTRRVYKPMGGPEEQEGLIPALSKPFVKIPRAKAAAGDGRATAVGKAVLNTAAGFLEFGESPLGVVTAGIGELPMLAKGAVPITADAIDAANVTKNVQRLAAAAYAADMASKVPEAAAQAGTLSVTGTPQEEAEAFLGLGADVVLPGLLGAHATEGMGEGKETGAEPQSAEEFLAAPEAEETNTAQPEPELPTDEAETPVAAADEGAAATEEDETNGAVGETKPAEGETNDADNETNPPEDETPVTGQPAPVEQPAEEPVVSTKAGSWTKWFPRSDGVPDVLDAIAEEGGIAAPSQSRFADRGEYDGYHEAFGKGMAARLRRSDGGHSPDLLMQALQEHGFDFETPGELYDAVSKAVAERKGLKGTQASEAAELAAQQAAHEEFAQVALKNRGRAEAERVATDAVPARTMAVGDKFTLKGEPFTVSHYDADTDVYTVDDGKVFGRQYLHGSADFFPDKDSVRGEDPDWGVATAEPTKMGEQVRPNARIISPRPIKEPYGNDYAISFHVDARDAGKFTAGEVGNSLPPEVRANVTGVKHYPSDDMPTRVELSFNSRESAQTAVDYFKTPITEAAAKEVQASRVGQAAQQSRAQAARTPRPGPTPPPPAAAPMPPARVGARGLPALPPVSPIRAYFKSLVRPFQNMLGPHSIDLHARTLANILRENGGKAAIDLARADEAMAEYRRDFDRTPVAKDWKYDPAQPLPPNYKFLDLAERNRAALSPAHQAFVTLFDDLFQGRIAEVRRLAPKSMQNLIQDYFPHVWKDPKAAAQFTNAWASKAPLHGDKSFLKQRSIPYILDGLKKGLVPVSDNPADLLLMKLHQMDKFILAERTLQEASKTGLRKYLPVGQRVPDGWAIYNDRSSTVNGPPVVTVKEAFDAGIRKGLLDLIQKLGFSHTRVARLPTVDSWGQYTPGAGKIETRFGGPDSVITHELGHGLDERYNLQKLFGATHQQQSELRRLANERADATASPAFKKYIQQPDERIANLVDAYVHAPEIMQKFPALQQGFAAFIQAHPELHALNDIKPSKQIQEGKMEIPLPGYTVMGHYIMPESAVQVMNNYLSPGLSRFAAFRTFRAASNIMNAAQLGLSAFHLGFTSLDAAVSSVAVGLQKLSTLDPHLMLEGARKIATSPAAPVTNYYLGKAVQEAMLRPGSNSFKILGLKYGMDPRQAAQVDAVAKLAVTGGLRATVDPFYKTTFTRTMVRAFNEGGVKAYARTALNLPMAIVEQSMRQITEFLVPRQKLGVFAQLARHAMDQLGPGATHDQVREAMAKAADSTENRMGQMTYDNLFYNKIVKDTALLGFRAYGWQLGKYRETLGAVADTAGQVKTMASGQRPELTHRMAYVVALPMLVGAIGGMTNYLMTGQRPQSAMDYFFPRNGQTGTDGRPQRLMLPSYLKDLVSDWHDAPDLKKMGASFYHKLNPLIGTTVDLLRNRNFYDTEIRHEDDPFWKQQMDNIKYVGKTAEPFAVAGHLRLLDEGAGLGQIALPYFGIVPAKKALTMTPAEAKASDLMQNNLPAGTRTQANFDHAQLLKKLVNDVRNDPINGKLKVHAAAQAGQLKPGDDKKMQTIFDLTPLQYQVSRLNAGDAMKVWDLANPQEQAQLKDRILMKVSRSSSLDDETRGMYLRVLTGAKPLQN